MTLSPADYDQASLDATKYWLDVWVADREEVLTDNKGWVAWALGPPKQRWAGYYGCTWPEDWPLILTEGYYDLRKAGIMPELRAVLEYQHVTQPVDDGKGGQTIPVPSDMRPYAWARWISCEREVFEFFANDARKLYEAARKDEAKS